MSLCGYGSSPVVFEPWLLFAHLWVMLTFRLADYEDGPYNSVWAAVQGFDPRKWNLPQQCLVPVEISLWECHLWCQLGHVLMWSEVCPLVFWFWGLLGGPLVQIIVRCCLWLALATCLELQSDPQFVVASAGPGCTWWGGWGNCIPRLASNPLESRDRSAKGPRHLEICHNLLAVY